MCGMQLHSNSLSIAIFMNTACFGGVELSMYRLALGLRRRGHKIVFILGEKRGELLSLIEGAFEVVDLHSPKTFWSFRSLASYFEIRRPDVIISNLLRANFSSAIASFISKRPPKIVMVDHALLSCALFQCKLLDRIMGYILAPILYRRANNVVAVSHAAAIDSCRVTRISKNRIRVIYNPVIPFEFEDLVRQKSDHPWLQNKEKPVIVSAGRLHAEKGFSVLVNAFAELRDRRPARLIILGDGEERPKLERQINDLGLTDDVSMPGVQSNIFPFFSSADLVVLPSEGEAFGNVLVEALACGTPVISTDCGGPSEILDNGKFGGLVPVGNSKLMAGAMLQALDAEHDRDALKQRGLVFTIDKAASSYEKLFFEG